MQQRSKVIEMQSNFEKGHKKFQNPNQRILQLIPSQCTDKQTILSQKEV